MTKETVKSVHQAKHSAAADRTAELSSEYGRLVHLRDEIDGPPSEDILRTERLRRVDERIDAIETGLSYEIASSLEGALGQAIVASADIASLLESEFTVEHELQLKERIRRLLCSITMMLQRASGIDVAATYGSYAPVNPFEEVLHRRAGS